MKTLLLSGLWSFLLAAAPAFAATLVRYDFEDLTGDPIEVAEGLTASAFASTGTTIYAGGTGNPGAAASASGWNVAPPDGERFFFFSFTLTPAPGLTMEVTGFSVQLSTGDGGPQTYRITLERDGLFGAFTGGDFRPGYFTEGGPLTFSTSGAATFRLYAFDAAFEATPLRVDNILVTGAVVPEPAAAALLVLGLASLALRRRRQP